MTPDFKAKILELFNRIDKLSPEDVQRRYLAAKLKYNYDQYGPFEEMILKEVHPEPIQEENDFKKLRS